ncbi:hypothetical protein [Pendulispora albinea]|uniref:Uncharacterized protein n=1 Tax=Pendulispora albinea TaxID=2741071 RepID=A0ABZ2M860_9BACT
MRTNEPEILCTEPVISPNTVHLLGGLVSPNAYVEPAMMRWPRDQCRPEIGYGLVVHYEADVTSETEVTTATRAGSATVLKLIAVITIAPEQLDRLKATIERRTLDALQHAYVRDVFAGRFGPAVEGDIVTNIVDDVLLGERLTTASVD